MNYTLQDVLGSLLAFGLFSLVFVFPGYVIGHTFDLLDFRRRTHIVRYVLSVVLSNAIIPILLFLAYRLGSASAGLLLLFAFALAWALIELRNPIRGQSAPQDAPSTRRYERIALAIAIGWVIFSILFLVDIQIGNRLYFNIIAYDLATRASLVDAISRTGIPMVSPGFYPKTPNYINQLYYFWYIPASAVDVLGGALVTARQAMISSVAWCGLDLMASLGIYLRLRNREEGVAAWKGALFAISLLAVSGLDVIPALSSMLATRLSSGSMFPGGDIEHWNEQITAWVGSLAWVPHHVSAMLACMVALMLVIHARDYPPRRQFTVTIFAGLAMASSLGLSTWVAAVFALFWCAWLVTLYFGKASRRQVPSMIIAGIIAALAAMPFLLGLLKGGSGAGVSPIAFEIRRFVPTLLPWDSLPRWGQQVMSILLLPVNYFAELGLFMIVGLRWLRKNARHEWRFNAFYLPEILLLSIVCLVASFIRSTLTSGNDLGWRSWLFGQFVLLVWAVDLINSFFPVGKLRLFSRAILHTEAAPVIRLLIVLALIGILTTVLDVLDLRTEPMLVDRGISGFPNDIGPDTQAGKRNFAARQAYDFVRARIPAGVIIESNPSVRIDRAGGLYGDHQMAIAGRAAYGVSRHDFWVLAERIKPIFIYRRLAWGGIDRICSQTHIGALVINDEDPIWKNLPNLLQVRTPLYINQYYAVFACGDYAQAD
jgi:hypothetical protein